MSFFVLSDGFNRLESMNTIQNALRGTDTSGYSPLWTADEAASFFQTSVRWLRDSRVPKVRLGEDGRLVRYIPSECMEYARINLTHSLLSR